MTESQRILVVDDEPNIADVISMALRYQGFEVETAGDGASALQAVASFRPHLLVLDIMLPDVDGFEVARRLKGEERTRSIPIVMLTALDRDEHRQRSKQMGVVAYLTKPFDPDRLMEAIRTNANGKRE